MHHTPVTELKEDRRVRLSQTVPRDFIQCWNLMLKVIILAYESKANPIWIRFGLRWHVGFTMPD